MPTQTPRYVFYLIASLLVGVVVTLLTDKIEDVAVEARLAKSIESNIRNSVLSFKESARSTTPRDELAFVKRFVDAVMKDKVAVYDRATGGAPATLPRQSFLFTLTGPGYTLDFYIQEAYLKSELAILDVPDYLSGLVATVIAFTGIVAYTENRRKVLDLQQQLEVKHAELDTALKQHEALALLGRMSAALAHELKTPIATISNLVQTLPSRRSDEQFLGRFLALTRHELNRTQQLIDNLLAYGKEIDIRNSEWIEMGPFLNEAAPHGCSVDAPQGLMLFGDRFYLDLLFKNLLRNSREAGAEHVSVRVAAASGDGNNSADLLVDDDGAGFGTTADMEKLTDPFVTSRSRGGGLGLYLAKKIAVAHGGSLALARKDKGARVVLTMPAARIRT